MLSRIWARSWTEGRHRLPERKTCPSAWTKAFSGGRRRGRGCPQDERHLDARWKIYLVSPCSPRYRCLELCRPNAWILTDFPIQQSLSPSARGELSRFRGWRQRRRRKGRWMHGQSPWRSREEAELGAPRHRHSGLCAPKVEMEEHAFFLQFHSNHNHDNIFVDVTTLAMSIKYF